MCSCDQSLVILAFLWEKLSQTQFYKDLTRKTTIFDEWSWFRFNNLGLTLGKNLTFFTSVSKGLKLKVRKFWGLIPTFVEATGEKLLEGPFCPTPLILNRVKYIFWNANDSIVELMVSITSGVSLRYSPCYKNMLNYDNGNKCRKLTAM